jgi:hypothetical protein
MSNRWRVGEGVCGSGGTRRGGDVSVRGQDYGGAIVGCGKRALTYQASHDAGVEPAFHKPNRPPAADAVTIM